MSEGRQALSLRFNLNIDPSLYPSIRRTHPPPAHAWTSRNSTTSKTCRPTTSPGYSLESRLGLPAPLPYAVSRMATATSPGPPSFRASILASSQSFTLALPAYRVVSVDKTGGRDEGGKRRKRAGGCTMDARGRGLIRKCGRAGGLAGEASGHFLLRRSESSNGFTQEQSQRASLPRRSIIETDASSIFFLSPSVAAFLLAGSAIQTPATGDLPSTINLSALGGGSVDGGHPSSSSDNESSNGGSPEYRPASLSLSPPALYQTLDQQQLQQQTEAAARRRVGGSKRGAGRRPKYIRTKTGCLCCRAKRVKCDEE